jgi:hypothetical protein
MPYPDFLPNFESTSMTDLEMFVPIILLEEKNDLTVMFREFSCIECHATTGAIIKEN